MGEGGEGESTLQKSILFTPLLPSAGPTGGLGLACPAPTISFTIWSAVARAFDIVVGGLRVSCLRFEGDAKFWSEWNERSLVD